MFDRKEIKAYGKLAYKANYWKCVLVAFLATLATSTGTASSGYNKINQDDSSYSSFINGGAGIAGLLLGAALIIVILALFAGIALKIFLLNPLTIGCNQFFLCNRADHNTELNKLEHGFKSNYKNIVKTLFMRDLFIFLWTLLLVIPGIIKSYDYYLVGYLMSENPNMDYNEALETSHKLMYGNKWAVFVFDLSFIGWFILGILTLGIVNLLVTQPYVEASKAELFVKLAHPEKVNAIDFTAPSSGEPTVEFTVE